MTNAFKSLWEQMKKISKIEFTFLNNLWNRTLKPMGEWLVNSVFAQIVSDIATGLQNSEVALQGFNIVLGNIAAHTFDSLTWLWDNILQPMEEWSIETFLPVALDTISAALETVDTVIEEAKPAFQWIWNTFFVPIRDFAWETTINFLNGLTSAFKSLTKWCKENPETVKNMANIILGFLAGIWVYNTTKKVIDFIKNLKTSFDKLKTSLTLLASPTNIAAFAIGTLAAGIVYLAANWNKLTPAQRTITMLGALSAALIAAAVAIALFHTSWSVGIAAAAIAAGIALLAGTYLFKKANEQGSTTHLASGGSGHGGGGGSISQYAKYANMKNPIPKLAQGAVLPANKPFLAQLGDQKNGRNLEAPESLLREIYSEQNQPMIAILSEMLEELKKGHVIKADKREIAKTVREGEKDLGKSFVTGGFANAY